MKIILTEKQFKLIIESESEDRLFTAPIDILNTEDGFIKMANLYFRNKEKKNYAGIYIDGDLNLDYLDYPLDYQEDSINDFLDEVVEINGYFSSGQYRFVSKFSKLKYVSGLFEIPDTEVTELPNLIKVGDLNLIDTKITTLPLLERVDQDIYLRDSEIVSIPNLVSVGRRLYASRSKIKSLPKLESVGADYNHEFYKADLDLWRTQITDLPNLKYVDGNLNLNDTPLGKKLKESGMNEEDIKDKFGVKGDLYI